MKFKFIVSLAVISLASCVKNEILPLPIEDQEIGFQTVVGSMVTKASGFGDDYGFNAYAFQHEKKLSEAEVPSGNSDYKSNLLNKVATWTNAGAIGTYITGAEISKQDSGEWKNASTSYYWPKATYLTFFAWADNANKPATVQSGSVSCTYGEGIKVSGYSISDSANKNKDFLVAEAQYNQTKYNTDGSPIASKKVTVLFHHQLSAFKFKAKVDKDYGEAHEFWIKSIEFTGVANSANYTQLVAAPEATSSWSSHSGAANFYMINAANISSAATVSGLSDSNKGVKLSTSALELPTSSNEYTILLPQEFTTDTPTVKVVYYAVDKIGSDYFAKEFTIEKDLKTVFSLSDAKGAWLQEKEYVLTVSFGLDEIIWDTPQVNDWIPANGSLNI